MFFGNLSKIKEIGVLMKGLICKKLYIPLTVLLICMFLISGCGGSPSATTTSNPIATTTPAQTTPAASQTTAVPTTTGPQYGGTLNMGSVGSPLNLGYSAKTGSPTDRFVGSPAQEQLIDSSYGEYKPWLAESWVIAEDGKSITFKLRQGVKFHDGTSFNAEAVKVNFDLIRTSKEMTIFKSVTSVDVVDEYTVRLNLTKFEWTIMSYLATHAGCRILSPKALTENTPEELLFKPVGTGPFKFVSYQKDTVVKYERFDDYWQEGKPYLDAINYKIFADNTTATMAMQAGEVDVLTVTAQDMMDLKDSGFNIAECIGNIVILVPDGANADSPFADVRVRQALSYAIDREMLAESLGYGYYTPTHQTFGEWSDMGYNPDIVGYPYDPAKAKQLLTEAGYADGFETSIIVGRASEDLELAIQDMLADVNITAQIQEVTGAKFAELSVVSGWQNGMLSMRTSIGEGHQDPAHIMLYAYMSEIANKSKYFPDDLKALFNQTKTEIDLVKRKALFQEVMKKAIDEYCMVTHVYNETKFFAVSPDIHYPELTSYHTLFCKMEDIWKSK
jgi:peptide/nickel transport system substrate-binding protein